jgi:hypothetical protein
MSTRDDASLSDRERAALASLEAVAAADDPQLAKRLRGTTRFHLARHLPRIPAWLRGDWWAAPLLIVGLALVAAGLSTTVVLSGIGAVLIAGGLYVLVGLLQRRWAEHQVSDRSNSSD